MSTMPQDDYVEISSDSDDLGNPSAGCQKATASPAHLAYSDQVEEGSRNIGRDQDDATEVPRKRPKTNTKDSIIGIKRAAKRRARTSAATAELVTLPECLTDRAAQWERRRKDLNDLLFAPSYDDILFSDDERLDNIERRPRFDTKPPGKCKDIVLSYSRGIIPGSIAQWLRDYQVEGAQFLHEAFVYQRGAILGDDMGLGKTIQVIAFLAAAFGKTGDYRDAKRMRKMRRQNDGRWYPRILIVVPGSLLYNWLRELETWGFWTVQVYHASGREAALATAKSGRLEIMMTTYDTYATSEAAINEVEWNCVIADECHKIKTPSAQKTQAMGRVNALCRIGLTGTAIQNDYDELWTILNWANPGKVGTLHGWQDAISKPLQRGQSHDALQSELSMARSIADKLVKNILPNYFLRRLKTLIADQLPKKTDRIVFCPMTELQTEVYNNFCTSHIVGLIRESTEFCDCGSNKKRGWCCYTTDDEGRPWMEYAFPAIHALRKLSNHLALLPPGDELRASKPEQHDKEMHILEECFPDDHDKVYRLRNSITQFANQEFCGKWRVLKRLLSIWYDEGDKVLIFSHGVRLLKMLYQLFQATTDYNVSYLDGSLPYEKRQEVVDEYNATPRQFVFLISTKAGGVGLNITSANKVVIVDPDWNPSHDLQAQDRAYRIGQTRDVEVFRLVSQGSMEENVYARQIYKQQQARIAYTASTERRYFTGIQDQPGRKGEIFGLSNLFAPTDSRMGLQDIVNKTNIAESKAGCRINDVDLTAVEDNDEANHESEDATIQHITNDILSQGSNSSRRSKPTVKKKDPIAAILDSAGVTYTHDNAQLLGSSKLEETISSHAKRASHSLDFNMERAFNAEKDIYEYNPPLDVKKRQFCSMAKSEGYDDPSDFALLVESWTQEQRRVFLQKWYRGRKALLGVA